MLWIEGRGRNSWFYAGNINESSLWSIVQKNKTNQLWLKLVEDDTIENKNKMEKVIFMLLW